MDIYESICLTALQLHTDKCPPPLHLMPECFWVLFWLSEFVLDM